MPDARMPYHAICSGAPKQSENIAWCSWGVLHATKKGGNAVRGATDNVGWSWKHLVKFTCAIILAQAIYWLLIDDKLLRSPPQSAITMIAPTQFEIASLKAPTLEALQQAQFTTAEASFSHCCDTASFAARMTFPIENVPSTGLGIISTLQVDNYLLLVNGSVIVGHGRMEPGAQTFHGQRTFLTRIPSGLLKVGNNELTYITIRDGFPYTDISPPIMAEYDSLQGFAAQRLWVMNSYPLLGGMLLSILGVVAAIMAVRSDDRPFAGWLSLLCAAFAANALYEVVVDPPFGGLGRMIAFFAVNLAVPTAVLGFVVAWSQRPMRWLTLGLLALYGLAIATIVAMLSLQSMPAGFDNASTIWSGYHLVVAGMTLGYMLWHFATHRDDRIGEFAILSVLVTTGLIDGLSHYFPDQRWMEQNLAFAAPFLMMAMIIAFIARNIRLFQSQETMTRWLRTRVEEREAELGIAHQREQQLVRATAHHDERRRIMRDLHDGLGSQLMAMLLAARMGDAEPKGVAEGLQSVVDEMRLMVDSMDSAGDSLASALAIFRQRITPQIQSVGVALQWEDSTDGPVEGFGPRDVLQIFRILQEAATNALKHASASEIGILISPGQNESTSDISVSDNGRGFDVIDQAAGRGLRNMRARAQTVGGEIVVSPRASGGTTMRLTLPIPSDQTVETHTLAEETAA